MSPSEKRENTFTKETIRKDIGHSLTTETQEDIDEKETEYDYMEH